MPTATPRALRSAIDSGSFDPVYLLRGDEDYIKEDVLRLVLSRAVQTSMRDFNVDVCRGADLDAVAFRSLLEQLPMMSARRVVVVRDAQALKKPARAVLDAYLEKPSPDIVLVLVLAAGEEPEKTWTAHSTVVECHALSEEGALKWISHHLQESHGGSITPDAAALLISHVGSDLAQLSGELDKLMSYTNGAEIDATAVQSVVGIRHGETMADLLRCVAERDAKSALTMLPRVMAQPKTTGVLVVMHLTSLIFGLSWGVAALANGMNRGTISREYYSVLKEGGAMLGGPWGDAVQRMMKALPNWTTAQCDRALDLLLTADMALKDTRASSEEQVVEAVVLAMAATERQQRGNRETTERQQRNYRV